MQKNPQNHQISKALNLDIFIPDFILSDHHLSSRIPVKTLLIQQVLNSFVQIPQRFVPVFQHIHLLFELEPLVERWIHVHPCRFAENMIIEPITFIELLQHEIDEISIHLGCPYRPWSIEIALGTDTHSWTT